MSHPVKIKLLRTIDLLNLELEYFNFELKNEGRKKFLIKKDNEKGILKVIFSPQHLAEEICSNNNVLSNSDIAFDNFCNIPPKFKLSEKTELFFDIPTNKNKISFSISDLLDWNGFTPRVSPLAVPPPSPTRMFFEFAVEYVNLNRSSFISPSNFFNVRTINITNLPSKNSEDECNIVLRHKPLTTKINCPFGITLSPDENSKWNHSLIPITKSQYTEVWHTSLKTGTTLRAISCEGGYKHGHSLPSPSNKGVLKFEHSLMPRDRVELVGLTTDRCYPGWRSRVIKSSSFMLSSLGATLDIVFFHNDNNIPFDLLLWKHKSFLGRDIYVETQHKGYLLPFGFAAHKIEIVERKFNLINNTAVANLNKKEYIVIETPKVNFPAIGQPYEGRSIPFRSIKLNSPLITPELYIHKEDHGFWVKTLDNKKPVLFDLVAEDLDGKLIEFNTPLYFAFKSNLYNIDQYNKIKNEFISDNEYSHEYTRIYLKNQEVSFTRKNNNNGDSTSINVTYIDIIVEESPLNNRFTIYNESEENMYYKDLVEKYDQPTLYPSIKTANVSIPALMTLLGEKESVPIEYNQEYKEKGFNDIPNNKSAEIFANILNPNVLGRLAIPNELTGGLGSYDPIPGALSRAFGMLGGSSLPEIPFKDSILELVEGNFKPKHILGTLSKLFGGINFSDILEDTIDIFPNNNDIPKIVTKERYAENNSINIIGVDTIIQWETDKLISFSIFQNHIQSSDESTLNSKSKLKIRTEIYQSLDGTDDEFITEASLSKFSLNLFETIIINFNSFEFRSRQGEQAIVTPNIKNVKLGGALAFVEELLEFIKSIGRKAGLDIKYESNSIIASLSLPIPSINSGIWSITNINFIMGVTLSLIPNRPLMFNFCLSDKSNPMALRVLFFAGAAYFCIGISAEGIEMISAGFEARAQFDMDIGIASAFVYAGFGLCYGGQKKWITEIVDGYEIEKEEWINSFSCYLRFMGQVDLFRGFISISLEFMITFGYTDHPKPTFEGQVKVYLSVSVWIFSATISFTAERKITDPELNDYSKLQDPHDWSRYADIFV